MIAVFVRSVSFAGGLPPSSPRGPRHRQQCDAPPEFSDEQYEVEPPTFTAATGRRSRSCDPLGQAQSAAPRIALEAQKEATLWEDSHTRVKSAGRSVKLVDIDERRRHLFARARAKNPARRAAALGRDAAAAAAEAERRPARARRRRAPGSTAVSRRRSRRHAAARDGATACGSRPRRRGAHASAAPRRRRACSARRWPAPRRRPTTARAQRQGARRLLRRARRGVCRGAARVWAGSLPRGGCAAARCRRDSTFPPSSRSAPGRAHVPRARGRVHWSAS